SAAEERVAFHARGELRRQCRGNDVVVAVKVQRGPRLADPREHGGGTIAASGNWEALVLYPQRVERRLDERHALAVRAARRILGRHRHEIREKAAHRIAFFLDGMIELGQQGAGGIGGHGAPMLSFVTMMRKTLRMLL